MKNKKVLFILIIIIISISILVAFIYNDKTKLKELTTEEKLEDFRYMYNIFEENYPHFYEVKEIHGWDWLANKDYYEKKIADTEDNIGFLYQLNSILALLYDGHADVMYPDFYYSIYYDYMDAKENDINGYTTNNPWMDTIVSAEKKYRGWYEIFKEESPIYYKNEPEEIQERIITHNIDNIVTKIIEDEKIAYLKIKSFLIDLTDEIISFLKDVKDYPYLIIDIMDNGGGNDSYWYGMVNSLLNENKKVERHFLIRGGEYSEQFLETIGLNKEDITRYPNYNNLSNYAKENLKYHIWLEQQFANESSIGFNGQIFLLLNENTLSSSINLVNVVKQTDLATIVGHTTRGWSGISPLYVKLPNSGLIVRCEWAMELNEDGTSNFMGIKPDIEIENNLDEDYNQKVIQETMNIIHSMEEEKE